MFQRRDNCPTNLCQINVETFTLALYCDGSNILLPNILIVEISSITMVEHWNTRHIDQKSQKCPKVIFITSFNFSRFYGYSPIHIWVFDFFSFFSDSPQVRYLVTGSESGSESENTDLLVSSSGRCTTTTQSYTRS